MSERQFKIEGIQRNCSEKDFDSRERFLCLKQNDTIVRKEIKNRLGEFSIKNLKPGNYTLEYKNIYGQTCSEKVSLKNKNVTNVELCTDNFIDTKEPTYFDEIKNDTLTLEFHSSGCFHMTKKEIKFYRQDENIIVKTQDDKGVIKTKTLNGNLISQVSLFFRKLTNIENGMAGCTTVDSYILRMKSKKDLLIVDGSCDWRGFYEVEKILN